MKKKYDVILYGASGFTGKQTVAYFLKTAPASLKWAIAGRNQEKLSLVLRELNIEPNRIDIIVADSQDPVAIDNMVRSTKVILSTAGPYRLYGENIIASSAKHGVDYVDITGETAFIRSMMDKYEAMAKKSGAKIIPFCGFDSIPSDIGVFALCNHIQKKFFSLTDSVKGAFTIKGGLNGGTLHSMITMMETGDWEKMKDPTLLNSGLLEGVNFLEDSFEIHLDKSLNRWLAPFVMGIINTRVVNRSAALFFKSKKPYGPNFSYSEYHNLGDWWNPISAFVMAKIQSGFNSFSQSPFVRSMMQKFGPAPSEGPSEITMNSGFFRLEMIGNAVGGQRATLTISENGDPGNRATVKFVCESALALALERDKLPGGKGLSGFLTPATGLGQVLIERLIVAGVKFDYN